jgi:hypothetical protein
LLVGLALYGSEQVRDRAVSMVQWAIASPHAETASAGSVEQPVEQAKRKPSTWTDWLLNSSGETAEPQQERVARYLSRRYRVAESAVQRIVGEAFSTGRSIGVDPLLILAVTAIESSLNPFAQSSMGAQGLMQVMTRMHSEKFVSHGGDHAALDPIANLKVGSQILRDYIRLGGSVERGLQLYVGAGNLPDDGGYSARVLGEMSRIKLAAKGDLRGALAAASQVDDRPALTVATKPAPTPAAVVIESAPASQQDI